MARNDRVQWTFTPQFKKGAVALLKEGRSASDVARSLGIARSLLQRWKDQLDRKRPPEVFPATGNATPEAQEIAELRKKLRRVTEERDILKKQILSHAQDRARLPAALPNPRGGPLGDLRVHRMFLQPNPDALDAGLSITRGV